MLSRRECVLLERLWREQARTMRAFVVRRTGDPVEADDVVAEVYWRACRALAQGACPRRNAKGWIWQILHHYRIDRARRRARTPVQIAWDDALAGAPGGTDTARASSAMADAQRLTQAPPSAVALEERARVRAAVAQLPPRQARLVVLRHFDGYSLSEIAAAFGITYGAAKAIHQRALVGLRAALGVGDGTRR